ncbi:hypothetical protein [Gemmatimonas sp.]|uniref:hypothetical protein n=1 Tax=Gemmatimonas sp. TaxID=1962908 RepID=UPI00356931AB
MIVATGIGPLAWQAVHLLPAFLPDSPFLLALASLAFARAAAATPLLRAPGGNVT